MSITDVAEKESTLRRLFLGRRPARGLVSFTLPGGRALFQAGDAAEALYLVRAGRLVVMRRDVEGRSQVLGIVRPGDPVGEMALISGQPHSATVLALRDTEMLALPRELFLREARLRPDVMAELAGLMLKRAREPVGGGQAGAPTAFGFFAAGEGFGVRALVEQVAAWVRAGGSSVAVVGADALGQSSEWFSRLELAHDLVIYAVESGEREWRMLAGRQVDRLLLVGRADAAPPERLASFATRAISENRLVDAVLLHGPQAPPAPHAQAWMDAARASRLFHVHEGSTADIARLARMLAGRSVGLVLSGGGARAYAHIGAIRALREAGQPIDLVGGASMGGIVGAGLAMGWDAQEMDARIQEAFVKSNPMGDMAWPMVALSGGRRVKERLREHFGDVAFADLRLPFFCVSSNLTTGLSQTHREGRVRDALRASCALPGVIPPVVDGANVLVDGGVLNNLPTDVMRAWHRGPVFGVDVAESEELSPEEVERPPSMWRFVVSGAWRKRGPPLVALLMRAATVTTHREFALAREASDALVTPDIPDVGLQDWKLYAPAVEAGYAATRVVLARLPRPLTDLRRPSPAEAVATREDMAALSAEPEGPSEADGLLA